MTLIDRIYEASVMTERWPDVLQDIANQSGAKGATIMMRSPLSVASISSPAIADDVNDFVAQGWGLDADFIAPLFADQWPGFRAETDYRTPDEIAALPVHAEFLDPRGYFAGAATVIQGSGDFVIHTALEGFASHRAAKHAIASLDELRPHLARSISLTALRTDQSQLVVDSLTLVGAAAAIVGAAGRLRSVNDLFVARMGNRMVESAQGLRFTDSSLMARLSDGIERYRRDDGRVQSVAIRPSDAQPFVIHILPIAGRAKDVCGSDGVLLLIADAANASIPSADLLRLLFDLTPAEARVARGIASGKSVAEVAFALGVGQGNVRVHLKAVFAKVGCNRQAELVRLLSGLGSPHPY